MVLILLTLSLMKHKSWDLPPPSDLVSYLNICGDLLIVVDIDMDVVTFNSLGIIMCHCNNEIIYEHFISNINVPLWRNGLCMYCWCYSTYTNTIIHIYLPSIYIYTICTTIYEQAICSTKGKGMWKSLPIRKENTQYKPSKTPFIKCYGDMVMKFPKFKVCTLPHSKVLLYSILWALAKHPKSG